MYCDLDLVITLAHLDETARKDWLTEQQVILHERLARLIGLREGSAVRHAPFEVQTETLISLTREIVAIVKCLRQIDAGTYGKCADCQEPIPLARLRAYPASTRCKGCQAKLPLPRAHRDKRTMETSRSSRAA